MAKNQQGGQAPASAGKIGIYLSFSLALWTALTFGVAIFTPPLTGPFCSNGCFSYPFVDAGTRFPRDYYWMGLAIVMLMVYIAWTACIHQYTPAGRKTYSLIGLSFALIAGTVLIGDYYVQLSAIQPAFVHGETDGVAMLSQFNPHGVFIALEELGYLLMSVSFIFIAPVFTETGRLNRAVRTVFMAGFALTMGAFLTVILRHGIQREYLFEVYAITITWFVLIINGALLGLLFRLGMQK